MSAPDFTIILEPMEQGAVVYGVLAPKTANDPPAGQLSLILSITNHGDAPVHVGQVGVSFSGPPNVAAVAIAADLTIDAGSAEEWNFMAADNIILPVPAPSGIKISVVCDGFSEPATMTLPLAAYAGPAIGAYAFPANADDLAPGEFWLGRSAIHDAAGEGTQLFAYDLGVQSYDASTKQWSTTKPGSDVTKNESYHAWGKPVYAMADGVVYRFRDGVAANVPPNFPVPPPKPIEGNHFYIQHGDELAVYAHLQAGTLNPALMSGPNFDNSGAPVQARQLLGLAGNSGKSSEPHLHVQVNRTVIPWEGPPRPLPFGGIYVIDRSVLDPPIWPPTDDAPWTHVAGADLPAVVPAIWPGALHVSVRPFWKWFAILCWAWLIIIGGLMITPGGVQCIACGPFVTTLVGIASIVLGILGFVSGVLAGRV